MKIGILVLVLALSGCAGTKPIRYFQEETCQSHAHGCLKIFGPDGRLTAHVPSELKFLEEKRNKEKTVCPNCQMEHDP